MREWLKKMIGNGDTDPQEAVDPSWERLWSTPRWALRAKPDFPWHSKQQMLDDLRNWLGSSWRCVDIVERVGSGGPTAEYNHKTNVILLSAAAWAGLSRGYQGKLTEMEASQLFHVLVHEAIHGYSPVADELSSKGAELDWNEFRALKIFEEGFTECLTRALINRWRLPFFLEEAAGRELLLNMYPVEREMIEDLAGEIIQTNVQLKEWWKMPELKQRIQKGDELAAERMKEALQQAGVTKDLIGDLRLEKRVGWKFFFPAKNYGELPAQSIAPRVGPVLLEQADRMKSEPMKHRVKWAKRIIWLEERERKERSAGLKIADSQSSGQARQDTSRDIY